MTHESEYAQGFFEEKLGPKIVALARRVYSSGVVLTQKGAPLQGGVVKKIGDGDQIMLEEDLRYFMSRVAEVGGYDENANYKVIKAFLSEIPVIVGPEECRSPELTVEPIIVSSGLVEVVTEAQQAKVPDEVAMVPVEEVKKVKPTLNEHPSVPGLRLQKDGFFWKEGW